jgi:hypothetical protein
MPRSYRPCAGLDDGSCCWTKGFHRPAERPSVAGGSSGVSPYRRAGVEGEVRPRWQVIDHRCRSLSGTLPRAPLPCSRHPGAGVSRSTPGRHQPAYVACRYPPVGPGLVAFDAAVAAERFEEPGQGRAPGGPGGGPPRARRCSPARRGRIWAARSSLCGIGTHQPVGAAGRPSVPSTGRSENDVRWRPFSIPPTSSALSAMPPSSCSASPSPAASPPPRS